MPTAGRRPAGYTLAPDASLTEIVAEINAALDWLAANGAAHGINGKVVLSGWSAGGHLTAQCLGHTRVGAGMAVSGVFELGPIRDTYSTRKCSSATPSLPPSRRCGLP
jgi:acetyl esterase/lipase